MMSVEIVQDSPVSERDIGVVLCVFKMTGLPKAASLCSSTYTGFGLNLKSSAPANFHTLNENDLVLS